jgi:uncharacterized protein (TIGR02996 family)
MNQRQAFLQAITDDPRDLATRRAFADWLDEHDEPELADFHRQWTVAKYDDARKWLQEFAEFLNHEGGAFYEDEEDDRDPNLSADDLLAAMHQRVRTGAGGIFLGFDTPDECWEGQERMWECFELITGQKVREDTREEGFFRCAC